MKHNKRLLIIVAVVLLAIQGRTVINFLFPHDYVEFFKENPDEVQIVLDRGRCFGSCPAYYFIIFGEGEAYLLNNAPSYNVSTAFVPREEFLSLLEEFENRRFLNYKDRYSISITDLGSTSTGLKIGDQSKYVYNYGGTGPRSLEKLEDIIDSVREKTVFTQVNLTPEICEKMYSNTFYFLGNNWSEREKEMCYYLLDRVEECLDWYQTVNVTDNDFGVNERSCLRNLGLASINLGSGENGR